MSVTNSAPSIDCGCRVSLGCRTVMQVCQLSLSVASCQPITVICIFWFSPYRVWSSRRHTEQASIFFQILEGFAVCVMLSVRPVVDCNQNARHGQAPDKVSLPSGKLWRVSMWSHSCSLTHDSAAVSAQARPVIFGIESQRCQNWQLVVPA